MLLMAIISCKKVLSRWAPYAVIFALSVLTANAKVVTVRLNNLEIGIDSNTGSIVSLSSLYTGSILRATPDSSGLLDLAYPVESFTAMRLASRFSKAQITQPSSGEVDIKWEGLGASRPNLKIPSGKVAAQVIIKAANDGRSIILSCHIENRSGASVPQELFPDLWGLQPLAGVKTTRLRLARGVVHPFDGPVTPVDATPEYYRGIGWKVYPAGGYYVANALRWLDFGGFDGGLSVFQRKWGTDDRPDVLTRRTERNPDSLRLVWEHKQQIKPGQSWDSGEFWLTPHPGGWAKGIEVYRNYVNHVNPPRDLPAHIRDDIGFQTIWMIQTAEVDPAKAAFRFADLPQVARDARLYGIHEIVPWGWCVYSTLPIVPRSELGATSDLLQGVEQSRALGVNIAPFISVAIVRNRYAARYGAKPGTSDWTYHPELIPMFQPYYTKFWDGAAVDTNNKIWEQDVVAALRDWIDKGLASFTWDVFEEHSQDGQKPGLLTTIDTVRKIARAKYPHSTFAGESVVNLEWDSQVLDYTWNWVDYEDAAPITNVLRTPRLNCNVEASPMVVKKCFTDDLFLNVMPRKPDQPNGTALISEKPALAAALSAVVKLRKEFLPYFIHGTFIGDSVSDRLPTGFVRGYQLKDRLLVIALNDTSEPNTLSVRSNLAHWLPRAGNYEIKSYDDAGNLVKTASMSDTRWVGTTSRLGPGQFAFFEIQAK